MELRELEYFQMVSRLKSFTKASEKLNISQPSITVAIKKLEEELGVSLFSRNTRTVNLTNEGEIFFQRVNKILNDLNNAVLEMNDFSNLKREILKIGVPPSTASNILPKIFKKYKKDNTNIELVINEFSSSGIVNLLEKEELDIGLIGLNTKTNLLETRKTRSIEILVCLPADHPLKDLPTIPFYLLKGDPFILIKEGIIHKIILEECKKNNFQPNVAFYSKLLQNTIPLVSKDIGITFTLDTIIINDSNIIYRSLQDPLYLEIGIAWKRGKLLTKAQQELINFITTCDR